MAALPTLALCIPAYNAARFLPRLLHSAAAQQIPFEETIVCDDASTDNTAEVARSLGAKVLRNDVNCGCSVSKNRALQEATADWVHFHDADDELLPNFTILARDWICRADAPDVVLFDYEYRDNETAELLARSAFNDLELKVDPIRYAILNQINPFCGLYQRERLLEIGGYDVDPDVLYNEDVAFHCKLAIAGLRFRAEKQVSIINYRVRGSMSGANQLKCVKSHCTVMCKLAKLVGERYSMEIASRLWVTASVLARHFDWESVECALTEARSLFPKIPQGQSSRFALLCKSIGWKRAFILREYAIRMLKPHLRQKLS